MADGPPQTVHQPDVGDDLLELPPGTRIGRYEILEVLGQGGFGITYRGHDVGLHRDVAIKEYLPSSFAVRRADGTVVARSTSATETFIWGRDRFTEEARTLAKLESVPGIVNVHDIVSANGTAYMVMEYVRGRTLESILRSEGPLSQQAIERLLPPLLDGLEHVHVAGFLHRDIKPANILIAESGRPSLIDFGASRMALQGRTQTLTAVYTPGYAAFEQFTSAKQGPPADIYALGATLYHAITGRVPPGANDRMIEDRLVPALVAGKGRYGAGLLTAIDAALRLRAADRPQTIEAWRRQLGLGGGTPAVSGGRWRGRAWAAVGAIVVAVGVAAPFAWEHFVAAPQRAAEKAAAAMAAAEREAAQKAAAEKARVDAEAKRQADQAAAEKAAAAKAQVEAEERRRADDRAAAEKAAAARAAVQTVPDQPKSAGTHPDVARVVRGRDGNNPKLRLSGTTIISNYAIQSYSDDNSGGTAVLKYTPQVGWQILMAGGGAFSATEIVRYGVPKAIADKLCPGDYC